MCTSEYINLEQLMFELRKIILKEKRNTKDPNIIFVYLVYDVLVNLFEMACDGIGNHHFNNRDEKHIYVVNVTIKSREPFVVW